MKRAFYLALLGLVLVALLIAGANYHVITNNRARLYSEIEPLPRNDVALVLGTSAYTRSKNANPHFEGRMDAAAALYRAGKVRHLLVSGDNRAANYDEPKMMRAALIQRGVPLSAITCDFAGFRTLDSVMRAQTVFGLKRVTIVTQRYHNSRALEISQAIGLDAVGFCTRDVELRNSLRTEIREVLARFAVVLDLYVLHRQPYFSGPSQPIRLASAH
ncbi:SanA/YdcF family protein [Oleiharenicola lentus]|uniref:SanA/YdcF family protein n=1 Tax=Oleiharenicola lentus TaxID=2508720 RepID=UPI003F666842